VRHAEGYKDRLLALMPHLNEKQLRIAAAVEAKSLGYGGVSTVADATGMARGTIHRALKELKNPTLKPATDQIRVPGGGRKAIAVHDPFIIERLASLLEANTRGDPMSPLLWTNKSTYELASVLSDEGHSVSADTIGRYVKAMGYSLQANFKTVEDGSDHPDRDLQFRHLNHDVSKFLQEGNPVISGVWLFCI
jgi:hypothetical protein